MEGMHIEQPTIYNVDRYRLAADLHLPEGRGPFPAVIILPSFLGTKDHASVQSLAEAFVGNGIAAIRFDPSGIGGSEGTIADDYRVSYYLNDVDTIYHFLFHHKAVNEEKIGICGISMGGMCAAIAAHENTRISPVSMVIAPQRICDCAWLNPLMKEWKSNGELAVEDRERGTLKVPYAFAKDAMRYDAAVAAAELSQPSQVILGSADTIVAPDDSTALFNALTTTDKELLEIPGMDHSYSLKQEHREKVNMSICNFMVKRFK